jgi:NAD(P)-dependent dehydrogenase (short-subunit alcohol dehydrogenase family)
MPDDVLHVPDLPRRGRLDGRVAVVTGAGSAGDLAGTGAAMAILFAAEGAQVVVLDRDAGRADHTLEAVQAQGGTAITVTADITDAAQCRDAVRVAADRFGPVDVLVNNAAIAPDERADTDEMWCRILDINLRGAKLMTDAVLPDMRSRGSGSVIMISSVAGVRGGGGVAYSAAKAGMIGLAKALAFTHGRQGIRANTVAPGHVAIPMGLGFTGDGWDGGVNGRLMRAKASVLGTEGTGWDVAHAALFFACDDSRYVTGSVLAVDGGTTEVMPIVMYPHLAEAVAT